MDVANLPWTNFGGWCCDVSLMDEWADYASTGRVEYI